MSTGKMGTRPSENGQRNRCADRSDIECQQFSRIGNRGQATFAPWYKMWSVPDFRYADFRYVCIERISFIDALRWLASAQDDELLPALVANPTAPTVTNHVYGNDDQSHIP